MNTSQNISPEDFRKILTPQQIMTLKIIYGALAAGVVLFAMVVIFLYQTSGATTPVEDDLMSILSYTHLVMALIGYPIAKWLYEQFFKQSGMFESIAKNLFAGEEDPAMQFLIRFRAGSIARLAIMEGIAFFGLVVCFLGTTDGTLRAYPIYWLNLTSSIIFVSYVIFNMPSKTSLEQLFREKMLYNRQ